jgi:hypothetical protein
LFERDHQEEKGLLRYQLERQVDESGTNYQKAYYQKAYYTRPLGQEEEIGFY